MCNALMMLEEYNKHFLNPDLQVYLETQAHLILNEMKKEHTYTEMF